HVCLLDALKYCFSNVPTTTVIYTLSLHDALPISPPQQGNPMKLSTRIRTARVRAGMSQADLASSLGVSRSAVGNWESAKGRVFPDRKSTRLNSSHVKISYAVFCLKKKRKKYRTAT